MGKSTAADLIDWTDEQLEEAGIDKARLIKIIRHLKSASDLMWGTGLHVYGGSSTGHIIHSSRPTHSSNNNRAKADVADLGSVVASVGEGFSGGDW